MNGNTQRCIVGLGSNQADRKTELREAFAFLKSFDRKAVLSPIYETPAIDMKADTPAFLNAVVALHSPMEPLALLEQFQHYERSRGRQKAEHYIDRPIDLDLLFYGHFVLDTPKLKVPHPRLHLRRFVLDPLADLLPDFFTHHLNMGIKEILDLCPDKSPTQRVYDSV